MTFQQRMQLEERQAPTKCHMSSSLSNQKDNQLHMTIKEKARTKWKFILLSDIMSGKSANAI